MGPNPSFNMANLITSQQPAQNMSSQSAMPMQQQSSNSELMKFLTVKFDEVNKRLGKLDTLERRVDEIDLKVVNYGRILINGSHGIPKELQKLK